MKEQSIRISTQDIKGNDPSVLLIVSGYKTSETKKGEPIYESRRHIFPNFNECFGYLVHHVGHLEQGEWMAPEIAHTR